ncbi:hypothetical protein E2C01_005210 [Portunus trituberculatus]|uniref:Uncharacterized protein n=1 Tax=Portunus trituberculatus TaxID=210409 RepID=A0A5B7CS07_PORTR|nr:hypothetical protein [Portunus trituberculatus]
MSKVRVVRGGTVRGGASRGMGLGKMENRARKIKSGRKRFIHHPLNTDPHIYYPLHRHCPLVNTHPLLTPTTPPHLHSTPPHGCMDKATHPALEKVEFLAGRLINSSL